jgi:hypothetical protein
MEQKCCKNQCCGLQEYISQANLREVVRVLVAKELSKRSEYQRSTTQPKRVGGPFRVGQVVENLDTGAEVEILRFLGQGVCLVRSFRTNRVYRKHYKNLGAL